MSTVVTMRYMHLSPKALDESIRLLDGRENDQSVGDIVETGVPKGTGGSLDTIVRRREMGGISGA